MVREELDHATHGIGTERGSRRTRDHLDAIERGGRQIGPLGFSRGRRAYPDTIDKDGNLFG